MRERIWWFTVGFSKTDSPGRNSCFDLVFLSFGNLIAILFSLISSQTDKGKFKRTEIAFDSSGVLRSSSQAGAWG